MVKLTPIGTAQRVAGRSQLQFPKRKRFNEEFDAKSVGQKSATLTNKSLSVFNRHQRLHDAQKERSKAGSMISSSYVSTNKDALLDVGRSAANASIPTRKTHRDRALNVEQHRQKIYDVVNNLTDEELERISEMLKQTDENFKQETVIEPELADQMATLSVPAKVELPEEVKGSEADAASRVSKATKNTLISSL